MFDFLNMFMKKKTRLSEFSRSLKITHSESLLRLTEIEKRKGEANRLREEAYQIGQKISLNDAEVNLLISKLFIDLERLYPEVRSPQTERLNYFKDGDDFYYVAEDR